VLVVEYHPKVFSLAQCVRDIDEAHSPPILSGRDRVSGLAEDLPRYFSLR